MLHLFCVFVLLAEQPFVKKQTKALAINVQTKVIHRYRIIINFHSWSKQRGLCTAMYVRKTEIKLKLIGAKYTKRGGSNFL